MSHVQTAPAKRLAEAEISRIVKYAPAELAGREAETEIRRAGK